MRRFIFGERAGIYIIDLQQTIALVEEAHSFVRNLAERGGSVLFVGTKKQAREAVQLQSERVDMPYVNHRWLGGLLTNYRTMQGAHRPSARAAPPARRRPARPAPEQGAHHAPAQAREARDEPRRRGADAQAAGRGHGHRPRPRGARRARGAPLRHPGDRAGRHELRPGRGRLRDPGQRRRDQVVPGDRLDARRRRGRGPQPVAQGRGRGRRRRRCRRRGGAEAAAAAEADAAAAAAGVEGEAPAPAGEPAS